MAGSLDDQRCHVFVVPEGFQFMVMFSEPNGVAEARLQMAASSKMDHHQVAAQLRRIANSLDANNINRGDDKR